jgi:hypothetical protein
MGAKGRPADSKRAASSAALRPASRSRSVASSSRAHLHAVVVGGQRGSAFRSAKPSASQKTCPLGVAHRGQEDLLAALHGEHVVHRPGAVAAGIGAGWRPVTANCSMCWPTRNTLFSNSALCTSMPRPVMPRCTAARQHADGAEHAAHDVVDAGAGAQRVARAAGHVGQAAHHLHHLVQRRAVLVGPGQEALVADVDQPRVQRRRLA